MKFGDKAVEDEQFALVVDEKFVSFFFFVVFFFFCFCCFRFWFLVFALVFVVLFFKYFSYLKFEDFFKLKYKEKHSFWVFLKMLFIYLLIYLFDYFGAFAVSFAPVGVLAQVKVRISNDGLL